MHEEVTDDARIAKMKDGTTHRACKMLAVWGC